MRRLFQLARSKSSAFAGGELSVAVLLVVLGILLLPALQKGGVTAAHSLDAAPPRPTTSTPEGRDQAGSVPAGEAAATTQPIITDGSVRKIKFDVNAGTFRQAAKSAASPPLDADY